MAMKALTVRGLTFGGAPVRICVPVVARDEAAYETALRRLLPAGHDPAELSANGDPAGLSANGDPAGLRADYDRAELPADYDLAELRADYWEDLAQASDIAAREAIIRARLKRARAAVGDRPLLFTFRTAAEGGERAIRPELYRQINEMAAENGVDLCDVEFALSQAEENLRSLPEALRARGAAVIGSAHDFKATPPAGQLTERLVRMQESGFDMTKAAVMPRAERDVLELLDASLRMKEGAADRPYITMSMGALGAVSRIWGSLSGSAVTFGTAGEASAPGQLPGDLLRTCLKALGEAR